MGAAAAGAAVAAASLVPLGAAAAATALPDGCTAGSRSTVTCTYGPGDHTFVPPAGVSSVTLSRVAGGAGGNGGSGDGFPGGPGGAGGVVTGDVPVTPAGLLITVGGRGGAGADSAVDSTVPPAPGGTAGVSGYGPGGTGTTGSIYCSASGGGGGASAVSSAGTAGTVLAVAAGGGGGGGASPVHDLTGRSAGIGGAGGASGTDGGAGTGTDVFTGADSDPVPGGRSGGNAPDRAGQNGITPPRVNACAPGAGGGGVAGGASGQPGSANIAETYTGGGGGGGGTNRVPSASGAQVPAGNPEADGQVTLTYTPAPVVAGVRVSGQAQFRSGGQTIGLSLDASSTNATTGAGASGTCQVSGGGYVARCLSITSVTRGTGAAANTATITGTASVPGRSRPVGFRAVVADNANPNGAGRDTVTLTVDGRTATGTVSNGNLTVAGT